MHKILIVKLGAIGDIVMASSMIKALKSKYAYAHITWFCADDTRSLVEMFEGIDEVISIKNELFNGKAGQLKTVLSAWKALAFKKYDLCLIPYLDSRYKLLPFTAFKKELRVFSGRFAPVSGRYHGTEYARFALGEDGNIARLYPLADVNIAPAERYRDYILLLAGGAKNAMRDDKLRRWPVDYYAKLSQMLHERGAKVTLIGGKGDLWAEEEFYALGGVAESTVGKTNIKELVSIIAGAKLLIAHDSGPRHIADLVNTPSLGIFGSVAQATRIFNKVGFHIDLELPCAPCYDGRDYADCHDNICMTGITPDMVMEKIEKYL